MLHSDFCWVSIIGYGSILVFEYLPEGLVYISSTVSKGFYNSTNNVWSIGDLSLGESVDLTLITYVKVGNFSLTNNVYVLEMNMIGILQITMAIKLF